MADIHVYSGATGSNDGTSWTDAYTSFATAVSNVTNSDVILVHYQHNENASGDTSYTFTNTIVKVYSVDKDNSDALRAMGIDGQIDTSGNLNVLGATDGRIFFHGITLKVTAGTPESVGIRPGVRGAFELEDCYLWMSGGNADSDIDLIVDSDDQGFIRCKGCTFRFANAGQHLTIGGRIEIEGGGLSSAGTAIDELFQSAGRSPGTNFYFNGFDLTHMSASAQLTGTFTSTVSLTIFHGCKLPSTLALLGTQTADNKSGHAVLLFDCASGDTHTEIAYADALGTLTVDSAITFDGSPSDVTWKIVTTANASFEHPFITPYINRYNDVLTAQSPYIEILRDGSSTAYQDDEVWGDFTYKGTSGNVLPTFVNDRMTPLGTAANQAAGAGLGSWTGENATSWSGRLDMGSVTAAEVGYIRGRICVGEPSITVYVDPVIRV